METIVTNLFIGLTTLLFGAMAIVPMLIEAKPARRTPFQHEDDQVISIRPASPAPQSLRPVASLGADHGDQPDGPQRQAA